MFSVDYIKASEKVKQNKMSLSIGLKRHFYIHSSGDYNVYIQTQMKLEYMEQ